MSQPPPHELPFLRWARGHNHAPVIVVGRPHSGTRMVTALLQSSGVFMGADLTPTFLDAWGLHQRFVVPLIVRRLAWPAASAAIEERLDDGLAALVGPGTPPAGRWGAKVCEAVFLMSVLDRALPGARFVHVVRDGRDVALSDRGFFQVTGVAPRNWEAVGGAGADGHAAFCRAVAFGDPDTSCWRGIDLADREALVDNRFFLQVQAWVLALEAARAQMPALGARYLELPLRGSLQRSARRRRAAVDLAGRPRSRRDRRVSRHPRQPRADRQVDDRPAERARAPRFRAGRRARCDLAAGAGLSVMKVSVDWSRAVRGGQIDFTK